MRFVFALLVLTLPACGTLFNPKSRAVSFSSDPEGARVYVNGQPMGTTPFQARLPNQEPFTAEFRKEGYQSRSIVVNSTLSAGFLILDIIPGLALWIIPVVVDAATGNWKSLETTNVRAVLEKTQPEG